MTKLRTGGSFESCPVGMHAARCYAMIELGLQPSNIETFKDAYKLILKFEVAELMTDGRPFAMLQWYTNSMAPKSNLRKALASWRGRDFNAAELQEFVIDKVVGAPCMLNIIHNDDGQARISAITPMPKGMPPVDLVNGLEIYDFEKPDSTIYSMQSDTVQSMIDVGYANYTAELRATRLGVDVKTVVEDDLDTDIIPF